jgi:Flp pilus assembly protein CpaB
VDNPADFEGQQKTATLAITFAVDPQQAELMTFAESYGKLQLVLRSPGEQSAYKLPSGNWETFTNYLQATQGVAIEPPVSLKKSEVKKEVLPEIRVYRGGSSGGNEKK